MKADPRVKITYEVTLTLTEEEARALDGLLGYGDDEFLKAFYKKLGKAYLQPHEAGFRSLVKNRAKISQQLSSVDEIRRIANGNI